MKKLDKKVAIVTGAGSGFGRATSLLFAEEGAKLVCVDYNEQTADETAKMISDKGGEAISVRADVSKEEDCRNFVEAAVKAFGRIDVLFNNAGIYVPGNVEDVDLAGFERSYGVNVVSIFAGTKYAMPYLKKTKGNIINTASAAGLIGFPAAISYAATKGAAVAMTRAIAVDYAKDGVRCNAICPGTGVTGMTRDLLENDKAAADAFLSPIPLGRFGQPEDIAHAALFLASDDAAYITGQPLPVDGGWTMS